MSDPVLPESGGPTPTTSVAPSLTKSAPPRPPRGLVLLLHGGAEANTEAVGDRSRAWGRARVMMWQVQRRLHRSDVAVWLLRYRFVGWNHGHGELPSPVPDARWALAEARREHAELPVVLVGHSMGGRTAAAAADEPNVVGVVALAPWFPSGEPVAPLSGKHLAAAHGRADRITSFAETERYVRRAAGVAATARMHDMGDIGHYMLRRSAAWNAFVVRESLEMLGDRLQ